MSVGELPVGKSRVERIIGVRVATSPSWPAPLLGALAGAAAIALVEVLAFHVGAGGRTDYRVLNGFWLLESPQSLQVTQTITNSASPVPFALSVILLSAVGLHARRWLHVGAIAVLLLGANLSTSAIKSVVPGHTAFINGLTIVGVHSFPSGHATASMSLVLSAVLLTPCRPGRRTIAGLGALYTLAVGWSVLVRTIHLPSDVIAGYLMAATWALLVLSGLRWLDRRQSDRAGSEGSVQWRQELAPYAAVLGLAIAATVAVLAMGPHQPTPVTFLLAGTTLAVLAVGIVATVAYLAPKSAAAAARRPV